MLLHIQIFNYVGIKQVRIVRTILSTNLSKILQIRHRHCVLFVKTKTCAIIRRLVNLQSVGLPTSEASIMSPLKNYPVWFFIKKLWKCEIALKLFQFELVLDPRKIFN